MKEIKQGSKYRYPELALLANDLDRANKLALICANKLIRALQCKVVDSDFKQGCEEYYQAIVSSASKGITNREMGRMRPFAKHQHYDHDAIIKSLMESGKIEYIIIPKKTQGRQRKAYISTDSRDIYNISPVTSVKKNPAGSEFKSVYWDNSLFKWQVQAKTLRNNIVIPLGHYDTEVEAINRYNEFTAEHPGKFPKLNKV